MRGKLKLSKLLLQHLRSHLCTAQGSPGLLDLLTAVTCWDTGNVCMWIIPRTPVVRPVRRQHLPFD